MEGWRDFTRGRDHRRSLTSASRVYRHVLLRLEGGCCGGSHLSLLLLLLLVVVVVVIMFAGAGQVARPIIGDLELAAGSSLARVELLLDGGSGRLLLGEGHGRDAANNWSSDELCAIQVIQRHHVTGRKTRRGIKVLLHRCLRRHGHIQRGNTSGVHTGRWSSYLLDVADSSCRC